MAPGKSPAFQFYPKDFTSGTATMSLQEVGAYVRLLCYQWDAGTVPSDPNERARILGCSKAQERELWRKVSKKFVLVTDIYLNERLEDERQKQVERRRRLSDAGKLGGRPTKAIEKPDESQSFPEAKANGKPHQRLASAFASSSSEKDQKPKEDRASRFDVWWKAYPKKIGKGAALKAWSKINPSQELLTRMLAALDWQRNQPQWTKDNGVYVPNPATYLNQARWEDEPFFATPAPSNGDDELLARLQAIERGEAKH